MDCIFCKIITGDIPAHKIYENETVLAFLDITPVKPGHILVVPKNHYETLLDTPDEIVGDILIAVKKIAKAVMKITGAEGFNLNQNNFVVAGQIVPHIHFHIIPRFRDDGLKLWTGTEYKNNEIEKLAEIITKELN